MALRKNLLAVRAKKNRKEKFIAFRVTVREYNDIKQQYGRNVSKACRVAMGLDPITQ